MKILVSYLSSEYNPKKTIDLINETSADGVHVDLMDGLYVKKNNLNLERIDKLFLNNTKPLDIHLMVLKPSKYLNTLFKLNPDCIYIDPATEQGILSILRLIKNQEIKCGIVINPGDDISSYEHYFPYVDRVLLMSVIPGEGGQEFIIDTKDRLQELLDSRKDNNFEIVIDGGINDKTIDYVLGADAVVSGSFICHSDDFEEAINSLRR